MRRTILMVLLGWSLAACSTEPMQTSRNSTPEGTAASVHVAVGDTLRLRVGQVAGVEGLRIIFEGIAADSRCPQGVNCVWAGDAIARLGVTLGRGTWRWTELHTHEEPTRVQHESYTLALIDLEPYPRDGVPIRADEYVAVLRVTRSAAAAARSR